MRTYGFYTVGLICWGLITSAPIRGADLPVPTEGEAQPSTPAVEAQKFAGTWKLVSLERDGAKVESQMISEIRLVFDANQYTYKGQDGKRDQGTFELDMAHNPPAIVTRQADGVQIGKILTQIYTWVDKDTLKFCAPGANEKMPDGFTAPHGSGRELAVWKRTKS